MGKRPSSRLGICQPGQQSETLSQNKPSPLRQSSGEIGGLELEARNEFRGACHDPGTEGSQDLGAGSVSRGKVMD